MLTSLSSLGTSQQHLIYVCGILNPLHKNKWIKVFSFALYPDLMTPCGDCHLFLGLIFVEHSAAGHIATYRLK